MKYLGIDYGTRRIGIAVSDDKGSFAFPKETIPNDASAIDRITSLIKTSEVKEVVMGDARAMNGLENLVTKEAEDFAAALHAHAHVPVHLSREAWSTVEAARFAPKGKEHDDAAAAAIILQRYLDLEERENITDEEEI